MTKAQDYLWDQGWSEALYGLERYSDYTWERKLRDRYIARFGFAILTEGAIKAMKPYGPFVEVGAGSGYWSWELQEAGVYCIATDPKTGMYASKPKEGWEGYTPVEQITGLKAMKKYQIPDARCFNLLMVWPDRKPRRWPAQTLRAFQGRYVVYVGEGRYGCTGDDAFHGHLEREFELREEVEIPRFWGIHDRLGIYGRKEEPECEATPALRRRNVPRGYITSGASPHVTTSESFTLTCS